MDTTLLQALALLETQDGKKSIKGPKGEDSYNLFNIKDFSGKGTGYRAFDKAEGSRDAYRVYGSREESIQDLIGLLDRRYPEARKALDAGDAAGFANGLKQRGYATDPKYVEKLTNVIASVRKKRDLDPQTSQRVAESAAVGDGAASQLSVLRESGYGDIIDDALGKGYKADEIVSYIAGEAQQQGKAAADRRASKGFLSNAAEGAVDTVKRLWRGGKQIVASDEEFKALQAQEAADRTNLDNVALRDTVGGKVGAAAPLVATAFIPGANTAVGGALVGAAAGALQPTVEGESRLANTGTGALIGGLAPVAGKLVGGALNGSVRAAQAVARGGRSVDDINQAIAAAEAQGITPRLRDLSPTTNRIANQAERTWGGGFKQADVALTREQELARALTRRMGQESDTLDSAYIKSAQGRIGKSFEDVLDAEGTAGAGSSIQSMLDEVIAKEKGGLSTLSSRLPTRIANELKAKEAAGGISAKELQAYRTEINNALMSTATPATAKQGLLQLRDTLTETIDQVLPVEKFKAWKTANEEWRNLQAAENLVRSTNDTGEITAKKLASAIKQGKFKNSYERGDAPFQDLQKALSGLEDGKGGLLGGVDGGTVQALGAYATGGTSIVGAGITANMALRLMNSTNPKVRAMVLGLTPVKQAELKRLALAAALTTQ